MVKRQKIKFVSLGGPIKNILRFKPYRGRKWVSKTRGNKQMYWSPTQAQYIKKYKK